MNSEMKKDISELENEVIDLRVAVLEKRDKKNPPSEAEIMQYCLKTLGVPLINFADVDSEGKPPSYLDGLKPEQRKDFIAHMEAMYADEKFQAVVAYVINLLGNHSIQVAEDDKMRNGKIGIIGIRTLMGEFISAHQEYVDSKKSVEGFDPLATMPE